MRCLSEGRNRRRSMLSAAERAKQFAKWVGIRSLRPALCDSSDGTKSSWSSPFHSTYLGWQGWRRHTRLVLYWPRRYSGTELNLHLDPMDVIRQQRYRRFKGQKYEQRVTWEVLVGRRDAVATRAGTQPRSYPYFCKSASLSSSSFPRNTCITRHQFAR